MEIRLLLMDLIKDTLWFYYEGKSERNGRKKRGWKKPSAWWESNPQPYDHKASVLLLRHNHGTAWLTSHPDNFKQFKLTADDFVVATERLLHVARLHEGRLGRRRRRRLPVPLAGILAVLPLAVALRCRCWSNNVNNDRLGFRSLTSKAFKTLQQGFVNLRSLPEPDRKEKS